MNRREFILKTAGAGLIAALTPVVILAGDEQNEEAKKEEEKEPTLEELAQKWNMPLSEVQRIDKEMKQPVMETLKGYAQPVCHSDYDQEVFQSDLPTDKRKPVLVMFYVDEPDSKDIAGIQYSRGLASVYKVLIQNFPVKVKFLIYDGNCDDWSKECIRGTPHGNLALTYDIRAPPSIAMYGVFDLLKGETQNKNDGIVKRIDTLEGGLKKIKNWQEWLDWLNKWISVNLINPEPKIFRYEHSSKEKFYNI